MLSSPSEPAATERPRLSEGALDRLPPAIGRPRYDRAAARPGIVHLGLGAFHRGHQAVFADDALRRGDMGWGIVAASLRSPETRDALCPQDGLYTFALRDGASVSARVVGSLLRIIVAPEEPEALIAALADPAVKLVTLTITEKGYGIDRATGRLDRADPAVAADLAAFGPPVSALGFLAAGLDRRRQAGAPPLTIVSCDNLPKNGAMLRAVLTEFAAARDPALRSYIEETIAFPSAMVDRIVPATTEADRREVAALTGLFDAWPVLAEPAFDWIVEDRFAGERPPFEASGVRFVADVEPYEHMKLRLLNGAHTAIAAIGRLAGFETVPQAVAHPGVRRFLERYWAETEPTLAIDAATAAAYRAALLPRFANPALPHRTAQIATDASLKVPQRLVSPARERLARGEGIEALVFAVAAWIRSSSGENDAGQAFAVADPALLAWPGRPAPRLGPEAETEAFLRFEAVFGADLPKDPRFAVPLSRAVADIAAEGVLAAMAARFG
ncbi:mannitol dehydrogenase [Aureimonas endophytica]|uniref:Mannitol dehydrogenase n=1 Tax=Aureimonas endophytica TaxID=2027858 RepID=A0A917E749_9HYPH|nr:mannitol dehydrogenase family protein [Aureimonas endophytica]GGE11388.1 mannitol dehydrogenase [Aureimonas endophytica]